MGWKLAFFEEMLKSGMAMVYPAFVTKCPNAEVFKLAKEIAKSKKLGVGGFVKYPPLGMEKATT